MEFMKEDHTHFYFWPSCMDLIVLNNRKLINKLINLTDRSPMPDGASTVAG